MRVITTTLLTLVITAATVATQDSSHDTLDIYVIDVEGGEATLFVSPSGESMLVDAGWPGFDGRDADRIAAAARAAGVTEINHLLITHFHTDHMGGALQLAERLPIRHFVDHGTTVDEGDRPRAAFARYVELRSRGQHQVASPGDPVALDGLSVRIIASHGAVLASPLPGAGSDNTHCTDFTLHGDEITSRYGDAEDQRSVSAFVGFGAFRTVIMGDLTWNKEYPLMCPVNKVGVVDLYLVSHHGSDTSGSSALVEALQPRAAVMNNGPRKGGALQTFQILAEVDSLEDIWQNHYSIPAGAANVTEAQIANLQNFAPVEDEDAVHLGMAHWIHIEARRDGSFTITNSRNGVSRDYAAR